MHPKCEAWLMDENRLTGRAAAQKWSHCERGDHPYQFLKARVLTSTWLIGAIERTEITQAFSDNIRTLRSPFERLYWPFWSAFLKKSNEKLISYLLEIASVWRNRVFLTKKLNVTRTKGHQIVLAVYICLGRLVIKIFPKVKHQTKQQYTIYTSGLQCFSVWDPQIERGMGQGPSYTYITWR